MAPSLKDYLVTAWRLLNGERVASEGVAAQERWRDIAPYLDTDRPLRILDLANGRLRPQYYLMKGANHHVVGIDLANYPGTRWEDRAYVLARWLFKSRIKNAKDDCLVCGDVSRLPFPAGYFDLITSVAAFEHFLDVPAVIAEMHRVLCEGGVAWIRIHPFTCPSGGHNVSMTEIPLRHLPSGVDAWDHLRKRRLPFSVPLNEWRICQYRDELSKRFVIQDEYCAVKEGEELLRSDILTELADYSREELTCQTYMFIVQKLSH